MSNGVSKDDFIENTSDDNKCITTTSFLMDINILKAPLFLYNNYTVPKIYDDDGNEIKQVEEKTYNWVDSKNMTRRLRMYCYGRLPRQFESDVLHGLIGLFIKKHAPFPFNYETNQYEINVNKLEFSWYELADFIKVQNSGYYIDRMKEAIRILKQTQYFSYENGVIYDKGNNKYIKSGEEGISLITKYKFKTNKKIADNDEYDTEIENNQVVFDELIINNLRHEYLKFLDRELFFSTLPSGISRGIYGYLEANSFDNNGRLKYIKRSYEALRIGIPIDFNYPYEVKKKLKKPLTNMIKIGYLKDFAFGDEIKINGKKEQCVYFCFNVSKEELKSMLEKKNAIQLSLDIPNVNDLEPEIIDVRKLELPKKSLIDELIDRKVDEKFARDVVKKKDKWDIIMYILWVDRQLQQGKIRDSGSILAFALRREETLTLSKDYQDIVDFIESEKQNEENSMKSNSDILQDKYDKYINENMEEFTKTPEYDVIKEVLLKDIEINIDKMIQNNKIVGGNVKALEEFKLKKEESKYFKDIITKEIKIMLGLMNKEDFISKELSVSKTENN